MAWLQTLVGILAVGALGGYAAFLIYDRMQTMKERRNKHKDKWN